MPPAWQVEGQITFPFGTDAQGRDLLTRIIFGARISLLVGILTMVISAAVGASLGALAGYYRGWFDTVLSRFADLLMAFPFLIFAIAMMVFIGPGFGNLIFALTCKGWVEFYRLVRGEMMSEKTREGDSTPYPGLGLDGCRRSRRDADRLVRFHPTRTGFALLVLSLNVFGEGLRDILDLRLKVE